VGVTKSLTVAELREHLQEYLTQVQDGTTIDVVDDGEKIATITPPLKSLNLNIVDPGPGKRFGDVVITPLSKPLDKDPAEVIIEERERERSGAKYK
jgi:antitoxin (DNA-binding transcriptional repressor) of toxin-antitoxin stability system